MRTSLRKIGNSVGILIPKPFLVEVGLKAGDPVDIGVKKGRIVIAPIKRKARAGEPAPESTRKQDGDSD